MEIIGKETINPILFYSGKICGYVTWLLLSLSFFNFYLIDEQNHIIYKYLAYFFLAVGLIFIGISLINLGNSVRIGIPKGKTILKTHGIYKISRNPMYVGFNLLTIASIFYIGSLFVTILGIYSIIVYRYIIIGEEIFLESTFSEKFVKYKKNFRRYL